MSTVLEEAPPVDVRAETPRGWSVAGLVLLLLGLGASLAFSIHRWDQVIQDDTYISLIYSRNLARGEGLVCNPGEEAVEGYTNFSWTVLAAGAIKLGWDPIVYVQIAGLICALGVVLCTFFLARRIGASATFAGAAALAMGLRPALSLEAMGGLETCLFALVVQLALLLTLSPNPRRGTRIGASVLLGLAALTRPEGVLMFGLVELSYLYLAWRDRAREAKPPVAWFRTGLWRWLPFALIVGTHLAWRWVTYHDYVPNTAHAKVSPGPRLWGRGFDYVFQGISYFGAVLFVLPYLLRRSIVGRGAGVLLFINSVYVFYIFFVGGDFKLTWRFFVVLFPIWCALAALSFETIATILGTRRARAAWLALFLALLGIQFSWEMAKRPDREIWGLYVQQMIAAGKHLNEVLPEGARIASTNAGCIPYHADRKTLDMMGLSDKHIAQVPVKDVAQDKTGHERGDGKYVLDQQPDVILLIRTEFTLQQITRVQGGRENMERYAIGTSEVELVADPRFDEEYDLHSVPLEGLGAYFNYFLRKSTKLK